MPRVTALPDPPSVQVTKSVAQSLTNDTSTTITYNTENWDTHNQHDNVTNNERLTCVLAGIYEIDIISAWDSNATGRRSTFIFKNGGLLKGFETQAVATQATTDAYVLKIALAAGDYITITARQASGGALNYGAGSIFGMTWVRP